MLLLMAIMHVWITSMNVKHDRKGQRNVVMTKGSVTAGRISIGV